LRYTDKTLGITDLETTLENQLLVSGKQLSIISFAIIDKIMIYDVAGSRVYLKQMWIARN
jgi:hypothetical protein